MSGARDQIDLTRDSNLLLELVGDLDRDVHDGSLNLDDSLACWAAMEEARRILAVSCADLADRLADMMGEKRRTVIDVGTFERHRKADRKHWDTDDLRRVVLDTRLVTLDGEIIDESPLDKILDVWNLSAPRITRLRARGIDPDEFCEVQRGGWTLQVIAS